jgi:hypothetical protein
MPKFDGVLYGSDEGTERIMLDETYEKGRSGFNAFLPSQTANQHFGAENEIASSSAWSGH